jgi:transcriptional regulator GlxA family with amidase domain
MVSVVIPALAGTASIGTAGLMDALNKADASAALQTGRAANRIFDVRLAGLDESPVSCRDGVRLHPSVAAPQIAAPDLVVVPGLDDDLAASFAQNRSWAPWLADWHAAGARIAGSCTGAFLIAEAGLLDGRPATTHWLFAGELRRRYPPHQRDGRPHDRRHRRCDHIRRGDCVLEPGPVPHGTVRRSRSRQPGRQGAPGRRPPPQPAPLHRAQPERSHRDVIVHQVQQHIDLHLDKPLQVMELASRFGLSERTLSRRFATATGRGPQAHLRHARVQHAMRLLETTSDSVDQVRRRAGYSDPAAFRRVFKDATGLTPSHYRDAYGLRNGPGS